MDRRLDKRYLTGAVSAMEKQYGVEKTDAIIEDAWRRYAEIVDENADEPKRCICIRGNASILPSPPLMP